MTATISTIYQNTMKITKLFPVLLLALSALWCQAQDAVPALINYQGKLLDGAGKTVPNGNYEIEFRIWSAGTGGSLIWGRSFPVNVMDGVFNVVLGDSGSALNGTTQVAEIRQAFKDRERYLGITITKDNTGAPVANPQEIVPRQQFLSAPFALTAKDASSLGGVAPAEYARVGANSTLTADTVTVRTNLNVTGTFSASNTVGGGMVPVGGIIMWSGSITAVPKGWALCNGQNGTPDLRNRFIMGWGDKGVGTTGGQAMQTLNVDNMPPHAHDYTDAYYAEVDGNDTSHPNVAGSDEGHDNDNRPFTMGRTTAKTGGGQAFSVVPPFYTLAFIQRIQ